MGPRHEELVRFYLTGQNLEHVRRVDEAVDLYERAVDAAFDSAGPYDRLIYIYRARHAHAEVARVAEAALRHVRTFEDKRTWYTSMRTGALEAAQQQLDVRGPEF